MHLPSVLYSFCGHCLEFLSIDFINLYKLRFIVNDGIAATVAIASYVISLLSIVEFGPDIEAIKVSYMYSGMSRDCL